MSSALCQGTTKKDKPCKNKAQDDGYCRVHGEPAGDVDSCSAESANDLPLGAEQEALPASTKTFELIVTAGAQLVDGLQKAIDHVPGVVEGLFKYSGGKFIAPVFSQKMQEAATTRASQRLQKLQLDLINQGADPAKLDELLEKTRKLERLAGQVLEYGGKHLPSAVKKELSNSYAQLKKISRRKPTDGE